MNTQYKIRSTLIFFIFCLFFIFILFNLYLIQIKNYEFYAHLAQKQYNVTVTQAPPRAAIFDRNGNFLALNKETTAAFILPNNIEDAPKLTKFLKKHFPQAVKRWHDHKDSHFMYIKRRLSPQQIDLIVASQITDIKLLNEPSRFYPIESTGQVIGITDIDNSGLFGIELQFNNQLAGTPSTVSLEKDARSGRFYFQKETKVQGKPGLPITLTLDGDLQFLVDEELKATMHAHQAKEGSAVILDPQTGQIFAMVNSPYFDPNSSTDLTNIELSKNKIITEVYELGSVMKVCSALSALEEGVVTPDELIDCQGAATTYVDGRKINTVSHSVAGIIPFSQVVAKSNNVGIAKVAKRLDKKIYDYYQRLGFGSKTGITFPGEQKGFVNHPNNWSKHSIISLSYGYELSASLLQLARAFSIIAHDGYDVVPQLILNPAPIKPTPKQLFSTHAVNTIKEIIQKNNPEIDGYRLMFKTGTANILVNGQYDKTRNLFTCAGIIEKNNYQRVIVVFINQVNQQNVYAATIAAPLLERLAKKLVIHDKII